MRRTQLREPRAERVHEALAELETSRERRRPRRAASAEQRRAPRLLLGSGSGSAAPSWARARRGGRVLKADGMLPLDAAAVPSGDEEDEASCCLDDAWILWTAHSARLESWIECIEFGEECPSVGATSSDASRAPAPSANICAAVLGEAVACEIPRGAIELCGEHEAHDGAVGLLEIRLKVALDATAVAVAIGTKVIIRVPCDEPQPVALTR